MDLYTLIKINFCWRQNFEMLIIHKPYLGSRYVPHKIWAQSFQPFWRLWDTNGQTPRQAKCIFRLTTFCPPEFYFLLSWFNSFGLLALKPSVPRLLIVTPTVYPHLVDFTRKLNFQNKSWLNQLKNLKTKLSTFPWLSWVPNRNLTQIGPEIIELWSDKQTKNNKWET